MKITIMHALPADMERAPWIIREYRRVGYADGSRPKQRDCVLYSPVDSFAPPAAVWGGPEHIRISFGRQETSA